MKGESQKKKEKEENSKTEIWKERRKGMIKEKLKEGGMEERKKTETPAAVARTGSTKAFHLQRSRQL